MNVRSSLIYGLLLGSTLLAGSMSGQAVDTAAQVRAARLTIAQGSVTVTQPGDSTGMPGQVNLPLLNGVQVATGGDGQAEIEFEDGSVIRLTPNTTLALDDLEIDASGVFITDIGLLRGLVYCELRATPQYSFMLNAGGDILSPVENATVRVGFDQPPATFAVLDGTAQIERQGAGGSGFRAQVRSGESLRDDTADAGRYVLTSTVAADSWDQWNDDLDRSASTAASGSTAVRDNYAGADGYGWSDLDASGSWYNVPGEGEVWQPDAAAADTGFDPYGNGAWVYSGGAGYVWASGYSWGWTPYRCGNWSYYNGFGWGWAPGANCGGRGWGFSGGGSPVNIRRFPTSYHPIRVPTPRPGPLRPILPVRPYAAEPTRPGQLEVSRGPRTINGQTVSRIAPTRSGPAPGGPAIGSSLRRDFPVDAASHRHEMGNSGGTLPGNRPSPAPGSGGQSAQPGYPNRGQAYPANGGYRPTPTNRPELNPPAGQRPAQPAAPASPSAPPYNPGQRYQRPPQQAPVQPAAPLQPAAPASPPAPVAPPSAPPYTPGQRYQRPTQQAPSQPTAPASPSTPIAPPAAPSYNPGQRYQRPTQQAPVQPAAPSQPAAPAPPSAPIAPPSVPPYNPGQRYQRPTQQAPSQPTAPALPSTPIAPPAAPPYNPGQRYQRPTQQAPAQPTAPSQPAAPPQQPVTPPQQRNEPRPPAEHPTYTPPPQQPVAPPQQRNEPRPPAEHPTYTPPPQQPQQPPPTRPSPPPAPETRPQPAHREIVPQPAQGPPK